LSAASFEHGIVDEMERLADFRSVFARAVMARAGLTDPHLLRAFSEVPRHEFIGASPWYFSEHGPPTISDDPALLYQDVGMGLAPERGITTGLPSLHARCMAACELKPGENVIQVGAGSGYFSAILAELVGESGCVVAFEIDHSLAEAAERNLKRWKQVRVEATSGVSGIRGRADVVYVSAGVQQVPLAWFEALALGGRLLVPITPGAEEGGIFLMRRLASKTVLQAEFVCRARFVPCLGAEDEAASALLKEAFAAGGHDAVRSLRLYPETPDETAWFRGRDWWLSTRPATG
jgi:protein-L-isoaspartate(D-aspartate) O-methyltransferase